MFNVNHSETRVDGKRPATTASSTFYNFHRELPPGAKKVIKRTLDGVAALPFNKDTHKLPAKLHAVHVSSSSCCVICLLVPNLEYRFLFSTRCRCAAFVVISNITK
uniref:Uncharacterized protein n=1 Tax=Trypanosoma congolense (strain IL3000) TaxID=1068625 RepID=G0UPX4_TRYCI|nr:hypothetical protein, unlikely [Trypanosoma congolense IL3000]